MQRWNLAPQARSHLSLAAQRLVVLLVISLWWTNVTDVVYGQVRIPKSALETGPDIQHILETGLRLEQDRRWGDALTHYEDALRIHPGRHDIQKRLTVSRIHFDLSRRYADSSYVRALAGMSEREALDLYSELLLKIDTHYVQPPSWHDMVQRGSENLSIALTDREFRNRHVPNLSQESLASFQRELRRHTDWQRLRTRQEARAAVRTAGRLATQRLRIPSAVAVMEFCLFNASSTRRCVFSDRRQLCRPGCRAKSQGRKLAYRRRVGRKSSTTRWNSCGGPYRGGGWPFDSRCDHGSSG